MINGCIQFVCKSLKSAVLGGKEHSERLIEKWFYRINKKKLFKLKKNLRNGKKS